MSNIIRDRAALRKLIQRSVRPVFSAIMEAPLAPSVPPVIASTTTIPPTQGLPPSGANNVSVSKVGGTNPGDTNDLQKGQITFEMVIEKLNSIRSGRSFKDEQISAQMTQYFEALNDNEKLALYAFFKGISQIVTADIAAAQAPSPQKASIEMETRDSGTASVEGGGASRMIKPTIVSASSQSAPQLRGVENVAPPTFITPKQR